MIKEVVLKLTTIIEEIETNLRKGEALDLDKAMELNKRILEDPEIEQYSIYLDMELINSKLGSLFEAIVTGESIEGVHEGMIDLKNTLSNKVNRLKKYLNNPIEVIQMETGLPLNYLSTTNPRYFQNKDQKTIDELMSFALDQTATVTIEEIEVLQRTKANLNYFSLTLEDFIQFDFVDNESQINWLNNKLSIESKKYEEIHIDPLIVEQLRELYQFSEKNSDLEGALDNYTSKFEKKEGTNFIVVKKVDYKDFFKKLTNFQKNLKPSIIERPTVEIEDAQVFLDVLPSYGPISLTSDSGRINNIFEIFNIKRTTTSNSASFVESMDSHELRSATIGPSCSNSQYSNDDVDIAEFKEPDSPVLCINNLMKYIEKLIDGNEKVTPENGLIGIDFEKFGKVISLQEKFSKDKFDRFLNLLNSAKKFSRNNKEFELSIVRKLVDPKNDLSESDLKKYEQIKNGFIGSFLGDLMGPLHILLKEAETLEGAEAKIVKKGKILREELPKILEEGKISEEREELSNDI